MSPLRFELAKAEDDAALRQILAATPMAGKVSLSFRREPSFFDAALVEGPFSQTIVARAGVGGDVVGLGTRSVRQRFINGTAQPVGYLGSLRILPQHRGGWIVARGYRYLRQLHEDRRTQIYLTTIAEDNAEALSVLPSGRAGLPRYEFYGNYHTGAIPIGRRSASTSVPPGVAIRAATVTDLPELCGFVARVGPKRQFFPCYLPADWFNRAATFHGLHASDMVLAWRGGEIVGTLGYWDQLPFRQIVVEGYGVAVAWSAPLYTGWAWLRGLPKLPKPGEAFQCLTGALPIVADDDQQIFTALLETVLARAAGRGHSHLLVGMHERDPLIAVVKHFQTEAYVTRCYLVCWQDGAALRTQMDGRVAYLELGCL